MFEEVFEEATPAKQRRCRTDTPVKNDAKAGKVLRCWQKLADDLADAAAWPSEVVALAKNASAGKTWLIAGSSGIGCKACARAKLKSPWAVAGVTACRAWAVHRHGNNKSHVTAADSMLGAGGLNGVAAIGAPPLDEFARLLELMGKGTHCDSI